MSKKKILVVCPDPIYPIKMGSQVRMFNLVKGLSKEHIVDVVAKIPSKSYFASEYLNKIKEISNDYYPILAPNKENNLKRVYYKIKYIFNNKIRLTPSSLFYNSIPALQQKVSQVANSKRYDIINCEFWYSCSFLKRLSYRPYLAVDTHDVSFEKFEKTLKLKKELMTSHKKLEKFKELELKYTGLNDLIISVSEYDYKFFKSYFPHKAHIKIPIGQDLNKYINYKSELENKNKILFYGCMSKQSLQNMDAFWTLYCNIFPQIKKRIKNCQLFVVGANPPKEIRKLANNDVIITGFVESIEKVISQTSVFILPLRAGGGFRTRVVETMALGVPIIGTHNALDNIELEHGIHGYIADSNDEMAEYAIKLLNNSNLRTQMGKACRKFVAKKYSIESTYGKLSSYYSEL